MLYSEVCQGVLWLRDMFLFFVFFLIFDDVWGAAICVSCAVNKIIIFSIISLMGKKKSSQRAVFFPQLTAHSVVQTSCFLGWADSFWSAFSSSGGRFSRGGTCCSPTPWVEEACWDWETYCSRAGRSTRSQTESETGRGQVRQADTEREVERNDWTQAQWSIFCGSSYMLWRLGLTVPSQKLFRNSVCPRQGWHGENV